MQYAGSGVDQPLLWYNLLLRATLQARKRRSMSDLFFSRGGGARPPRPRLDPPLAFSSSLSAREKARLFQASRKEICAIARASPWTPTTPLLKIFGLATLSVCFDLKLLLLTHRCVHSIASPLLCRQYKLRTQANSTYRTTRGQTFNSLCLPPVTRRSGELTPLYTSTLLYNNLPSELRSPNISFSLFHCTIMKYLGHPVRRP